MSRFTSVPMYELLYLVVDDDEMARRTVVEFLNAFGCEKVLEASSAIEALTMMDGHPIDFVLSDWEMPGLSGLELLRTMRKDSRWRELPFVMITAPISHENLKVEQAAISEVDAYILKPFRANVLLDKIGEALEECRERERKTALVVDDDPEVLDLMVEMLKAVGFDPVIQAVDGEEGFRELNLNSMSIALVVCDWEMPRMSGLELLQKVRIDRKLGDTPFLMVTSQTSLENLKIRRAIEADVDHYLLKPFTYVEFESKVNHVLERAKKHRRVQKKLERATKADRDGDSSAASILYGQVIQLDPRNIDAYLGLGHSKIKTSPHSGFDECIQMIKMAIKFNPRLERGYISLAHAFEKGGSLEKGIVALKRAFDQCPPSAQLHYETGHLLHRAGKHDEALAEAERALELDPDHGEARILMGEVLARIKKNP